ncbi:MAG: ATP-binding cassette domain-containing protein, partial [Rhodobacterales bacterium]|nr:ATP-binding cassette domain-containing protein [Rhodobacterales bacterium]
AHVCDGNVLVDVTHADAATLRRLRLHRVAMVFQQFGLLPWRTVRENVGLGLELGGMSRADRRARVEAQLELVNLTQWADRRVGELSGGMQQRVGLARAFATEAPILLMDEPFSALDPLIRAKLQDELLELQSALKRTIIFVSHDLDEAFKIGNRIAIMEGGRIVQCGTPQQIFTSPATDYVAEFVAHMNPLGVLTAEDVMQPLHPSDTGTGIGHTAPLRDVMLALQAAKDAPLIVQDAQGRPLGRITSAAVLDSLLDPRGKASLAG